MAVRMDKVRRLETHFTMSEAAEFLGYSRNGLHRLVFYSPNSPFDDDDVRAIGPEEKPQYLLSKVKVRALKQRGMVAGELATQGHARFLGGRNVPTVARVAKNAAKKAAPTKAVPAKVVAAKATRRDGRRAR